MNLIKIVGDFDISLSVIIQSPMRSDKVVEYSERSNVCIESNSDGAFDTSSSMSTQSPMRSDKVVKYSE